MTDFETKCQEAEKSDLWETWAFLGLVIFVISLL